VAFTVRRFPLISLEHGTLFSSFLVKEDRDLTPLWHREDFKSLVTELEAKTKPGK
jgi:hypothetical protein